MLRWIVADGDKYDYDPNSQVVWSPIYGNCFDIFAADESFGKSSLTGASYGLSLELQVIITLNNMTSNDQP